MGAVRQPGTSGLLSRPEREISEDDDDYHEHDPRNAHHPCVSDRPCPFRFQPVTAASAVTTTARLSQMIQFTRDRCTSREPDDELH